MAYRTKIELVVYSNEPIDTANVGLPDLLWSIDEGDDIGNSQVTEANTPVEGDQLRKELIAIGNDGTFFDDEDDE